VACPVNEGGRDRTRVKMKKNFFDGRRPSVRPSGSTSANEPNGPTDRRDDERMNGRRDGAKVDGAPTAATLAIRRGRRPNCSRRASCLVRGRRCRVYRVRAFVPIKIRINGSPRGGFRVWAALYRPTGFHDARPFGLLADELLYAKYRSYGKIEFIWPENVPFLP